MPANSTIERYIDLYRKLYNREPRDLQQINKDFVVVNEMQIRIQDLELLTRQLEKEYKAKQEKKRSTILKLVNWFRR
jgi:CO dehydrogenase/acetyl-CoA synthase alpha subunit